MKAVMHNGFGGPEVLAFRELPDPQPGPGEILVKVAATALNRADTLQRRGLYPPPAGCTEVPGLELSGTVVETGPGVQRWKAGDRVCALLAGGGHAEMAVLDEGLALPLPNGLGPVEAAALPEVFITAYQALYWIGALEPGQRVLIHAGASGVGTAALQLVVAAGAKAFATASAGKHELCRRLGAELTIDYRSEDFETRLREHTDGAGVHLILDFIGAPYWERNIRLLETDGTLVILAFMGGAETPSGLDLARVLRKRLCIAGSTLRARPLDYKRRLIREVEQKVWPLIESGKVRPVIDRVLPWSRIAEAHTSMEKNENQGKIVLDLQRAG